MLTWEKLTIRILPAAVLLTAGILKIHFLFTDVFLQHSMLLPTRIELAFAAIEVVFAIWLVLVGKHIFDWMVCVALFAGFAIFSILLIMMGQKSCGCFGVVHTSPWFSLGLDCAILIFVFQFRPENLDRKKLMTLLGSSTAKLAFSLVTLVVVGSAATFLYGSGKLHQSLNDEIVCPSDEIWVGEEAVGKTVDAFVEFNNLTSSPIRIVGGHSVHGDDLTSALPLVVEADARTSVPIKVKFRGLPGLFVRRVVFYTTSKANWQVVVRLNGRVTNSF